MKSCKLYITFTNRFSHIETRLKAVSGDEVLIPSPATSTSNSVQSSSTTSEKNSSNAKSESGTYSHVHNFCKRLNFLVDLKIEPKLTKTFYVLLSNKNVVVATK